MKAQPYRNFLATLITPTFTGVFAISLLASCGSLQGSKSGRVEYAETHAPSAEVTGKTTDGANLTGGPTDKAQPSDYPASDENDAIENETRTGNETRVRRKTPSETTSGASSDVNSRSSTPAGRPPVTGEGF